MSAALWVNCGSIDSFPWCSNCDNSVSNGLRTGWRRSAHARPYNPRPLGGSPNQLDLQHGVLNVSKYVLLLRDPVDCLSSSMHRHFLASSHDDLDLELGVLASSARELLAQASLAPCGRMLVLSYEALHAFPAEHREPLRAFLAPDTPKSWPRIDQFLAQFGGKANWETNTTEALDAWEHHRWQRAVDCDSEAKRSCQAQVGCHNRSLGERLQSPHGLPPLLALSARAAELAPSSTNYSSLRLLPDLGRLGGAADACAAPDGACLRRFRDAAAVVLWKIIPLGVRPSRDLTVCKVQSTELPAPVSAAAHSSSRPVLFTGDNEMRSLYHTARIESVFGRRPVVFAGTTSWSQAQLKLPSNCPFAELTDLADAVGDAGVDLVYTNFGANRFLHNHPAHPWWYLPSHACGEAVQASSVRSDVGWAPGYVGWLADYVAFLDLESFVRDELLAYSKVARQVVVVLPGHGCDEEAEAGGPELEASLLTCAGFVSAKISAGWPAPPHGRDALAVCSEGQLSSNGTLDLARRIRAAVTSVDASVRFAFAAPCQLAAESSGNLRLRSKLLTQLLGATA